MIYKVCLFFKCKYRNLNLGTGRNIIGFFQYIHIVFYNIWPILLASEELDGGTDDGFPFLQGVFFLGSYNLIVQSVG